MHIEIVVAFLLFMGFIIFLLSYIQPYKSTGLSDSIVSGLEDSFQESAKINSTSVFIKADSQGECFSVYLGSFGDVNSSVKSVEGAGVGSYFNGTHLHIDSARGSFRAVLSNGINESSVLSCPPLSEENYTIGSLESLEGISYLKIKSIKERFTNDYEILKKEFLIPSNMDFAISSDDLELDMPKTSPVESEVFANSQSYKVIYPNGDIQTKEFIFKIIK